MQVNTSESKEKLDRLESLTRESLKIISELRGSDSEPAAFPTWLSKEHLTLESAVHMKEDIVTSAEFDELFKSIYGKTNTLGKGGIFKGKTFKELADGRIVLTKVGYEHLQEYGHLVEKEAKKTLSLLKK